MPENFNFKVTVPGSNPVNSRPKLTLAKAINLIKQKKYTIDIEDQLIKAISRQPANTYEGFLREINRHIGKISKKAE
jgi:hypothetical protein